MSLWAAFAALPGSKRHHECVELRVWDGMWHNWPMYVGLPEADAAIAEAADFLERSAIR